MALRSRFLLYAPARKCINVKTVDLLMNMKAENPALNF